MRQQIISAIESALAPIGAIARAGLCLYYAHHVAATVCAHGLRAVIQAGSIQWPRVRREEDDGRMDTHFSYTWDPSAPASRLSWAQGNLPEIHVWVGLPDTQELIDFSTRHLRDAARAAGLDWTGDDPPRYLWTTAEEMPEWVVYTPHREATLLACRLLWHLFRPIYLVVPKQPRDATGCLRETTIYGS